MSAHRRVLVLALLGLGALPVVARAATIETALPIVSAMPGNTVQIAIDLTPNLVGLGVESIQYHLPIDPAVVSAVTLDPTGLVWNWGAPFTNVTATSVDVATFGTTPITDPSNRLHSLHLTVSPSATIGSSMVLILTTLQFNEGTPTIHQVLGRLRVGPAPTAVGDGPTPGFDLGAIEPNPARGPVRLAFSLRDAAPATLAVYGLDGRRVRTLAAGATASGPHEIEWDLRDGAGRGVPAGVYFAVLEAGGARRARRIVVLGRD